MPKILHVMGTRPETIKMAPVFKAACARSGFSNVLCVTGQHRQMLDQVLEFFQMTPDYDLDVMTDGQQLADVTSSVLKALSEVLIQEEPDLVLVHGDTNTTFAASLAAFYLKIPVGHVEAGLRTFDLDYPWPEEGNRQLTTVLTAHHFAPTSVARDNLLQANVAEDRIVVTGNSVIDALLMTVERLKQDEQLARQFEREFSYLDKGLEVGKRLILVTGHRRENFGSGFEQICQALSELGARDDVQIIYPVHLNPAVDGPVRAALGAVDNIHLIEPVDYPRFVWLMLKAHIILTDSGGVQEEAPTLGKPVLVMRNTTERPEAVEAGVARLVGNDAGKILSSVTELLDDEEAYARMSDAQNPYGKGDAAKGIVEYLENFFREH